MIDTIETQPKGSVTERLNVLNAAMKQQPHVDAPVRQMLTPGLYSREVFLRANTFVLSKFHKTVHQFVVLFGQISVWTEEEGWQTIQAPYRGVTKPGRRFAYVHTNTVWITFHATDKIDQHEIENEVIDVSQDDENLIYDFLKRSGAENLIADQKIKEGEVWPG